MIVGVRVVAVPVQNVVADLQGIAHGMAVEKRVRMTSAGLAPVGDARADESAQAPSRTLAVPTTTLCKRANMTHAAPLRPLNCRSQTDLQVVAREVRWRVADGVELIPQHALGPADDEAAQSGSFC